MAELKKVNTRIIHKHATAAIWNETNFTPLQGEIVIYDPGYDPKDKKTYSQERMKIGDGSKTIQELPFANIVSRNELDEDLLAVIEKADDAIIGAGGKVLFENDSCTASEYEEGTYGGESYSYDQSVYDAVYETDTSDFCLEINGKVFKVDGSVRIDDIDGGTSSGDFYSADGEMVNVIFHTSNISFATNANITQPFTVKLYRASEYIDETEKRINYEYLPFIKTVGYSSYLFEGEKLTGVTYEPVNPSNPVEDMWESAWYSAPPSYSTTGWILNYADYDDASENTPPRDVKNLVLDLNGETYVGRQYTRHHSADNEYQVIFSSGRKNVHVITELNESDNICFVANFELPTTFSAKIADTSLTKAVYKIDNYYLNCLVATPNYKCIFEETEATISKRYETDFPFDPSLVLDINGKLFNHSSFNSDYYEDGLNQSIFSSEDGTEIIIQDSDNEFTIDSIEGETIPEPFSLKIYDIDIVESYNYKIDPAYIDFPQLSTGSGDNSLQFAGAGEASGEGSIAMGDESSSVTDYSVAIGKEVTAGCKAYYFSAIDLVNKNIYLSETKEQLPIINTKGELIQEVLGFSFNVNFDFGGMLSRIKYITLGEYVFLRGEVLDYSEGAGSGEYTISIEFNPISNNISGWIKLTVMDGETFKIENITYDATGEDDISTLLIMQMHDSNSFDSYYNPDFEAPAYNNKTSEKIIINFDEEWVSIPETLGNAIANGSAIVSAYMKAEGVYEDDDYEEDRILHLQSCTDNIDEYLVWYTDGGDNEIFFSLSYTYDSIRYNGAESTAHGYTQYINISEHIQDEFCLINGEYHPIFCGKITAVDHNKITYDGDVRFTEISTTTTRDFDKDHVFYTPTNPSIGVIDDLFVGSFAAGRYNVAAGEDAVVAGYGNMVGANHGAAFGKNNRVGNFGFVTGNSNDATGACAYVEGKGNINKGYMAHVEGRDNEVARADSENNRYVHVEGYKNTHLKGKNNHVEGVLQKVNDGSYTHVEGYKQTVNSGDYLHIEGRQNISTGGTDNHIEGYSSEVTTSNYTHVEGYNHTVENGAHTHVEGYGNTVKYGKTNHIEGEGHTVEMPNSSIGHNHIEGKGHTVKSRRSHVQGDSNEARLRNAHDNTYIEALDLTGYHNIGAGSYQTVAGKWNEPISDMARITGGGEEGARKNIEELDWNGNLTLAGNVDAKKGTFSSGVSITGGELNLTSKNITNVNLITAKSINGTNVNATNINVSGNSIFGTGHTVSSANTQVEGMSNTVSSAKGINHVEGYLNNVEARYSHVEGVANEVTDDVNRVHVEGWHNIANANDQHVAGKYNKSNANAVRITGWGTSNTNRKNIEELDQSGNAWFAGSVTVGADKKILATEDAVAQKSQVQIITWEADD